MNRLPPCARCGGAQYHDSDPLDRDGVTCLMCGATTWPTVPPPWTPYRGQPRPPVWQGDNDA